MWEPAALNIKWRDALMIAIFSHCSREHRDKCCDLPLLPFLERCFMTQLMIWQKKKSNSLVLQQLQMIFAFHLERWVMEACVWPLYEHFACDGVGERLEYTPKNRSVQMMPWCTTTLFTIILSHRFITVLLTHAVHLSSFSPPFLSNWNSVCEI